MIDKKLVIKSGKPVNECPHCGCSEYFVYTKVSGRTFTCYQLNGQVGDNTHLHDSISYRDEKTAYCINCHRKIGVVRRASNES